MINYIKYIPEDVLKRLDESDHNFLKKYIVPIMEKEPDKNDKNLLLNTLVKFCRLIYFSGASDEVLKKLKLTRKNFISKFARAKSIIYLINRVSYFQIFD